MERGSFVRRSTGVVMAPSVRNAMESAARGRDLVMNGYDELDLQRHRASVYAVEPSTVAFDVPPPWEAAPVVRTMGRRASILRGSQEAVVASCETPEEAKRRPGAGAHRARALTLQSQKERRRAAAHISGPVLDEAVRDMMRKADAGLALTDDDLRGYTQRLKQKPLLDSWALSHACDAQAFNSLLLHTQVGARDGAKTITTAPYEAPSTQIHPR